MFIVFSQHSNQERQTCKVGNAEPRHNDYPECQFGIEFCGEKECKSTQEYCMAVFKVKEETGRLAPIYASCWEKPETKFQVGSNECVLNHQPGVKSQIMYECWCTGNLCNSNIVSPKYIVKPTGMNC